VELTTNRDLTSAGHVEAAIVFQTAGLLLDYPPDTGDDLELMVAAVAGLPRGEARERLERFLGWWSGLSIGGRKMVYVETFDLGTSHCLYVTANRSRDKRHRGRLLLGLKQLYRQRGLEPAAGELPDYFPLMLEFAGKEPAGEELLRDHQPAIVQLRDSLDRSASPFADVVAAVLRTAGGSGREAQSA
jgi:nitrate reductase molybdenum cofactor assembly chaperone NarJ/NarW